MVQTKPAAARKTPPAPDVQAPALQGAVQPAMADELVMVRLASIRPSPTNPRKHFDEAALAELAASIREHGVLEPVILRPHPERGAVSEAYQLVVGERRVRASGLAGKAVI